ncbi:hypothetical protein QZJ86_14725 [Methylomonas montana]|uniref:hypothetical protein n=1 Tax=Methylomonas montana TaxID=3058963 RepID=UPI002659C3AF|nr:hypothetical protein [Methylomonas montana]WKJ89272.1 hypothetical protein QZJ86_14725 [Methylomonas montana]
MHADKVHSKTSMLNLASRMDGKIKKNIDEAVVGSDQAIDFVKVSAVLLKKIIKLTF